MQYFVKIEQTSKYVMSRHTLYALDFDDNEYMLKILVAFQVYNNFFIMYSVCALKLVVDCIICK